ncbi:MAG: PAS domain-containing protein [Desulfuromonas sp.]|nr:PAS domain-containing protein [Desulfuromonas sp.]
MGKNNFDSLKITVLLYCGDELFATEFCQEMMAHCPGCYLMHAGDLESVTQLLGAVKVDVVLVDGRRSSTLMARLKTVASEMEIPRWLSILALIDRQTEYETELELLACGADDFVCADQPLHVAIRFKELCRLQQVENLANEYNQLLTGQSSQLNLLQMAVDNSNIMIATLDHQLRIQMANESFLRFCRLEKSDMPGVPISDVVFAQKYASHVKPALLRALAGEDMCIQSLQALSHPQTPYLQLYFHPLRDAAEEIQGAVLILNNIDQLKSIENRYFQMSREFRTLLDGISDAITLIRADGSVAWGNRAAAEVLNTSVDELPQHLCCVTREINHPERLFCESCLIQQCLTSGEKAMGLLEAPDGRRLGVKVFPLLDDTKKVTGMIRVVADITEAMQLRNEANQSSRLAALGELAAGVAHEINNPNGLLSINNEFLNDICWEMLDELSTVGSSEATFSGFTLDELRHELPLLFSNNRAATGSIRRIVEDLKQFTRREQSQYEHLDVNAVVLAAHRLVANSVKKATHSFAVYYAEDLPPVLGSFQGLEQVIINLLMNACQALPDPSQKISVKTEWDEAGQRVKVWVCDTGRGISAQDLEKIFDPFFTTKREDGGTGLGLAVSSRIIKEHGGFLHYDSQPGQGTSVCVSLPVGELL